MKMKLNIIAAFEDLFFHHDSAVLLPSQPKGPSSQDGLGLSKSASAVSNIAVIKDIHMFVEKNPDAHLIIVGHADTTGEPEYNYELARCRTFSVLDLLMGHKEGWVEISNKKNKVEDYQQILKHYSTLWGWDCDPGPIDNIKGPKTERAIRQFQEIYNQKFGKSIAVDGIVGKETWGAIFDCYIKELADMMDTTPKGMNKYSNKILFLSDSSKVCVVSSGEILPIEKAGKDNYRSLINRRVDVIFVDLGEKLEMKIKSIDQLDQVILQIVLDYYRNRV